LTLASDNALELPVRKSIRSWKKQQDIKRQELQAKLEQEGLQIPQAELQDVDGSHGKYSISFHSIFYNVYLYASFYLYRILLS
jgi:hypothetical protein